MNRTVVVGRGGQVLGALLAVLTLLMTGLGTPSQAQAGEYSVWSCRGPQGQSLPTTAWSRDTFDAVPGDVSFTDACASGGGLEIALADHGFAAPRKTRGLIRFDLPRGTAIAAYRLNRYLRADYLPPSSGSDFLYVAAVRERVGGSDTDEGCSTAQTPPLACLISGSDTDPGDPANLVQRSGPELDGLELWAGCDSAGCDPADSPPSAVAKLYGSEVVLSDSRPPSPPLLSGSLLGSDPIRGLASLELTSHDVGGGIATVILEIDGETSQVVESQAAGCEQPYTDPIPCPTAVTRSFVIDAGSLTEGEHQASGQVSDVAGNVTAFGPLSFEVERPATPPQPPSPQLPDNGSPAVEKPRLRLAQRLIQPRRGRPALLRGRLTTRSGRPILGAALSVGLERLGQRRGRARQIGPVRTGARGGFAVRVPGRGARRLTVTFAPRPGSAATASAVAVARSRLLLGLARRPARVVPGQPVTFAGRLLGAGAASRGAVVEIQSVVSGSWRTVATVTADARGVYRWRYRFRYVDRDALFSFRAVIRRTPGWPWPTERSRPVKVGIRVG